MRFPEDVPVLTDGTVTLRAHTTADIKPAFDVCQDPVMQQWTTIPVPYEWQHAEQYLTEFIPSGWQDGSSWGWAIEYDGRYAGTIDLRPGAGGVGEIGFGLAPWARSNGVMTRAVKLTLGYAFDQGWERVIWRAYVGNWGSRGCATPRRARGCWRPGTTAPSSRTRPRSGRSPGPAGRRWRARRSSPCSSPRSAVSTRRTTRARRQPTSSARSPARCRRAAAPPRPRLREPVRPPSRPHRRPGRGEGHRAGGRGRGRPATREGCGRRVGRWAAIGAAGLVAAALRLLVAAGHGDANALTNFAFWTAHPELFGTKLAPSQPNFAQLSAEWIRLLRDGIVRAAHAAPAAGRTAPTTPPATQPAAGTVPADVIAAESPPPRAAGATQAGSGDKYFAQRFGRYRDVADSGKKAGQVRPWLHKTSGANVCNMTSLTMGLVSMAGEDEVRARMIGLLRTAGMHTGAQVEIGEKFVDLAAALDDPRVSARIRTLDLVTAVAIGKQGTYKSVTEAGTIARVARDAGIATKARVAAGRIHLADPQVRAKAARMLADGTRVIVGSVNHYVYLTDVRDDGVVVHDPAGARVHARPDGLPVRPCRQRCGHRERVPQDGRGPPGRRRAPGTTNPAAAAVINELPAIAALPVAERAAAAARSARPIPATSRPGCRTSTRRASSGRTTCG